MLITWKTSKLFELPKREPRTKFTIWQNTPQSRVVQINQFAHFKQ